MKRTVTGCCSMPGIMHHCTPSGSCACLHRESMEPHSLPLRSGKPDQTILLHALDSVDRSINCRSTRGWRIQQLLTSFHTPSLGIRTLKAFLAVAVLSMLKRRVQIRCSPVPPWSHNEAQEILQMLPLLGTSKGSSRVDMLHYRQACWLAQAIPAANCKLSIRPVRSDGEQSAYASP